MISNHINNQLVDLISAILIMEINFNVPVFGVPAFNSIKIPKLTESIPEFNQTDGDIIIQNLNSDRYFLHSNIVKKYTDYFKVDYSGTKIVYVLDFDVDVCQMLFQILYQNYAKPDEKIMEPQKYTIDFSMAMLKLANQIKINFDPIINEIEKYIIEQVKNNWVEFLNNYDTHPSYDRLSQLIFDKYQKTISVMSDPSLEQISNLKPKVHDVVLKSFFIKHKMIKKSFASSFKKLNEIIETKNETIRKHTTVRIDTKLKINQIIDLINQPSSYKKIHRGRGTFKKYLRTRIIKKMLIELRSIS